tara:strand:+ start:196 stop:633 length:438 start_codon:yes stop_codon:yes gene_type:complete
MPSKATSKKTTTKKATTAKKEETQEESRERLVEAIMEQDEIIEEEKEEEYIPKRLVVELWRRHENNRNFDVKVGQVVWSDLANDIILEALRPDYAILLRTNLEANVIIGGPSRSDDPKEWVRTLYKADVATDIYALEAKEMFDGS